MNLIPGLVGAVLVPSLEDGLATHTENVGRSGLLAPMVRGLPRVNPLKPRFEPNNDDPVACVHPRAILDASRAACTDGFGYHSTDARVKSA